jgi:hypothetical protein
MKFVKEVVDIFNELRKYTPVILACMILVAFTGLTTVIVCAATGNPGAAGFLFVMTFGLLVPLTGFGMARAHKKQYLG